MRTYAILFLTVVATTAFAADEVNPRGIYISSKPGEATSAPHPAVKFRIELNRNGSVQSVPGTYRFRSGDRFRFLFELNQPSYVYVVNRSINGNPDQLGPLMGTRGINVVAVANGQGGTPELQLLWPSQGGSARLAAGQSQSIPGATQFFEFDANPGLEKISLLVSPYPVDPAKYFRGLRTQPAPPPAPGPRNDTNQDVLAQLEDLRSIEGNTANDPGVSRGICVGDCSQYSAPRNPARPFISTLDLLHTP